jgi:hypothetical protein
MFERFNDIYFIVYKLYYVGQNDNLGIRVSLKNWDRGSTTNYWGLWASDNSICHFPLQVAGS